MAAPVVVASNAIGTRSLRVIDARGATLAGPSDPREKTSLNYQVSADATVCTGTYKTRMERDSTTIVAMTCNNGLRTKATINNTIVATMFRLQPVEPQYNTGRLVVDPAADTTLRCEGKLDFDFQTGQFPATRTWCKNQMPTELPRRDVWGAKIGGVEYGREDHRERRGVVALSALDAQNSRLTIWVNP